MNRDKYNLLINKSFDNYTFDNQSNNSIFKTMTDNMSFNSLYLVLSSKPNDNTTSIAMSLNSVTQIYLFPTVNTNVSFNIGELIQTTDNNAIFIISNYIDSNLFALRLVWCNNGVSYTLKNNTQSIIYNGDLEQKWFFENTNKTKVLAQYDNYTKLLNSSNSLGGFFGDNILFATDYTTDYTIGFNFNISDDEYLKLYNIIDKFYINFWVYDYNDYKYIYQRDIVEGINTENYKLTTTNSLIGVLKTSNTKIIPHQYFKLKKGQVYSFTDTVLNKHTSYSKAYTGEKIVIIVQLSLKDKNTEWDIRNNVESDSIFIIV